MNYTLNFHDPRACKKEHCGGKGANLAYLTQNGFSVPDGFVVVADTYREFIRAAQSNVGEAFDFANSDRLMDQCREVQEQLRRLPLPAALEQEIVKQLKSLGSQAHYSVRSSSTLEDLSEAAFAGQHETYLNCAGLQQILEGIKDCYISLWSHRAVAYRNNQKFAADSAAMAVVVQKMVQADVAGVAFSMNPVNGNLSQIVIDANFGLGESVVSGGTEVDHFILDKKTKAILEKHIAKKISRVVSSTGATGTEEVKVTESDAMKDSLSDAQLEQVARLIISVEECYRFPQDIEWAIQEDRIHLLQSRPITTIPARWTRDESAERFPNVITPLTWEFVDKGFHDSLEYSFRLMGLPPCRGKWFDMRGHYIYGNQNAVELYLQRPPVTIRTLEELEAALPSIRERYKWIQQLPTDWMRDLDRYLTNLGRFMEEPVEHKSLPELWDYVGRVRQLGGEYFRPNIAISITHATLHKVLHSLVQMVFGAEKGSQVFDGLMAFCETKTGQINKELYELASLAKGQTDLLALLQGATAISSHQIIEEGLLRRFPTFHSRFEVFIRDHGHRELDFDAYIPSWNESPWVILDNVRLLLRSTSNRTPGDQERETRISMQKAELELFKTLPEKLHYFFFELLRLARLYTSLDDLEHYQTTRLSIPMRRGLRTFGTRLVDEGILREPMDIFFAEEKQITRVLEANTEEAWKSFATIVCAQKETYQKAAETKPEWILGESSLTELTGEKTLSGLPGSRGHAEGIVFVVHSSDDFRRFPKGSILVARTTNPSWTPLFYCATAVITESGGPLSHGAVTAREMGIPAVMSVRGCMTNLTTGQRVRVDGTNGKVFRLEKMEE